MIVCRKGKLGVNWIFPNYASTSLHNFVPVSIRTEHKKHCIS